MSPPPPPPPPSTPPPPAAPVADRPASSLPAPAVDPETISRLRLSVLRLSRRLRQNAAAGLTASHLSLISTLDRHGSMTLGDLAAHEGVQPPSVTRMVDALQKLELVRRAESAEDRRVVVASLTSKGRKAAEDVRRRHDAWLAKRLSLLSAAADRAAVEAALPVLEILAQERP